MSFSITISPATGTFPLTVSGRYIVDAQGNPFPLIGDAGWSAAVQLTTAQVDTYLNARQVQGFTAIMFNMIEHYFSSHSPFYKNATGYNPFSTMSASSVSWNLPVENYWTIVDYIVNGAKSRGMAVIAFPAYSGFGGGSGTSTDQGWDYPLNHSTDADLQTYGAWLANRYTQGNVIWAMGGDYHGDSTTRAKQWNIVTGIRSVRTTDIVTAHGARTDIAYTYWNGQAGFTLNTIYVPTDNTSDDYATTAYGQGMPFFLIEGGYEGESGNATSIRMAAYQTLLSGGCGHIMGNNPIWGFGEPNANGGFGAADALANDLSSTAANQMAHLAALAGSYDLSQLVPKRDTTLVTSSLGTSGSSGRICPALAADGSFGMVWVPSSQTVTVNMASLSPASVRARLFDPTSGNYSTVSGSPFANSGTQGIATGGERVIVLDQDPAPSYISSMADYQVRAMSGTYAPMNGTSTLSGIMPAGVFTSDDIMRPWSGGPKMTTGHKLWVHGGGHSDSNNNTISYFDFSGDTAPTGWILANAGSNPPNSTHPVSVHTYDGMCELNGTIYRIGGSTNPSGFFTAEFWAFNTSTNVWSQLTNYPGGSFGGMLVADPSTGKLLAMERWNTYLTYAFYNPATGTWSAAKDVAAQWPDYAVAAYNTASSTVYMDAGKAFSCSVNWSSETITQTSHTTARSSGTACVYDPTRNSYWMWGGGAAAITTIYEVNATTYAVTSHTLTGDTMTPESGTIGAFGRFVFMDDWRAIGFVPSRSSAAYIIKLPS